MKVVGIARSKIDFLGKAYMNWILGVKPLVWLHSTIDISLVYELVRISTHL